MCEFHIDGSNILLNRRTLYQRLILDQGYWKVTYLAKQDEDALIIDIDKIMSPVYISMRKHQKIEVERFLYWADVKGFLVWGEMAATNEFRNYAVTAFTRE